MTPGSRRLSGVALVTGATQGIGRAVARRLAADGAWVAVNDIDRRSAMTDLVDEIDGIAAPCDVSDGQQVLRMVADIERHSPVATLVCNAAYMTMGAFLDHPADDWWKVVETNLTGTFHLVQAVLPGMRRLGRGRIIIVSSYWGVVGWPNATAYASSKSGLIALTKTLGRELAPVGVIVNAVAPGVTATPQLEVDAADAGVSIEMIHQRYAENIPLGRIGRPEEIAAAVAFLADPRIKSLVGQVLQVNGGEVRCRA